MTPPSNIQRAAMRSTLVFGAVGMALMAAGCTPPPEPPPGITAPLEVARLTVGANLPVVMAHDFNGDDLDDLLLGDPNGGSYPRLQAGDVYLKFAPIATRNLLQDGADLLIRGQEPYGKIGLGLTVADMDGDGTTDVIIRSDTSVDGHALVRVVSGVLRGEQDIEESAFLTLHGPPTMGQVLCGMNYDADGKHDLVLTCPLRSQVYVVRGPRTGELTLPADADAILSTDAGSLGWSLAAGDFDGNQANDLAILDPIANLVYVVPTGLLGEQNVGQIATAIIHCSDREIIRSVDALRPTGEVYALMVRTRRLDSEQRGTLSLMAGPLQGDLHLDEDATLTLTDVPVGYGSATSTARPLSDASRLLAVGTAALSHLPDSSLTGQVLLLDASTTGNYAFDAIDPALPKWQLAATDAGIDLLGASVLFGRTQSNNRRDLITSGNGAVLIYRWE